VAANYCRRNEKDFIMAENHPQATPTTPEQDKAKTAPVETKPMEQPAKVEPQAAPEKKS
jgi:hypothetical protein